MCLILFAYKSHPQYPVIVAANRDEFYARNTKPAEFWENQPETLAGRDLEAGGTWMGVNRSGKISMLTNFRDIQNINPNAPSRGHLVADFLTDTQAGDDYLRQVEAVGKDYNGFNLLCGDQKGLYYYGNYQEGVHEVPKGIHGLSNALLNSPWPKVVKGKEKLKTIIEKEDFVAEELFDALYDDIKAPVEQLPDTGVGLEKESMLSPMFIKSQDYGSRCSTLLLIDRNNKLSFYERTYNTTTFEHTTKKFEFAIDQSPVVLK